MEKTISEMMPKTACHIFIPQATLQKINADFEKAEPTVQALNQFLDEKEPSFQNPPDLTTLNIEQLKDLSKISTQNIQKCKKLIHDVEICRMEIDSQLNSIAKKRGKRTMDKTENELQARFNTLKEKYAPLKQKAENQIKLEKDQIQDIFDRRITS